MTETEWLGSDSPVAMLAHLNVDGTDRKTLLYASALCHWRPELINDHIQVWADTIDQILAGASAMETLDSAQVEAEFAVTSSIDGPHSLSARAFYSLLLDAVMWSWRYRQPEYAYAPQHTDNPTAELELMWQTAANFVRDIFGNPFRPVCFSPSWRTDTVLTLAKQIDESRDFSAMPILADALQDAGCDDDDVLTHCRATTEHVRGCWVIDLVLEKS
jgi:hypothetical protein